MKKLKGLDPKVYEKAAKSFYSDYPPPGACFAISRLHRISFTENSKHQEIFVYFFKPSEDERFVYSMREAYWLSEKPGLLSSYKDTKSKDKLVRTLALLFMAEMVKHENKK